MLVKVQTTFKKATGQFICEGILLKGTEFCTPIAKLSKEEFETVQGTGMFTMLEKWNYETHKGDIDAMDWMRTSSIHPMRKHVLDDNGAKVQEINKDALIEDLASYMRDNALTYEMASRSRCAPRHH